MPKPLAPSKQLAAKVTFAALKILKARGGEAPGKDVVEEIEKTVELDDWAKSTYEKTGKIRWQSILHFFSIDLIKAGFLVKKKGVWYLTPEGDAALSLGEVELLATANQAYRSWREANPKKEKEDIKSDVIDEDSDRKSVTEQAQEATLQEMEELANEGLRTQINSLNPYEFQDLVGALLRAMGYHTPFIAPKGKDGGVDIIAYQDPLGVVAPRIKVQIKHRESSASVDEVRQLMGLLQRDGDVGIFVSSGGFTYDTKMTARASHIHVELIDLDRLIELWHEFYSKLEDEDKNRLRLKPIYFYEPIN